MEQNISKTIDQLFINLKSIICNVTCYYENFENWMEKFDLVMAKIILLDDTEYIMRIIRNFYDAVSYYPINQMTDIFKIAQKLVEYYQINIHLEQEYFLARAVGIGYCPLIQYLINHGADFFVCSQSNIFESCVQNLVYMTKSDENGMECFKLLTELGIDLGKYNLLPSIISHHYWNMTDFLLGLTGINPNIFMLIIDKFPPESLVRNLIQRGVDIHYHNDDALMIAITNRDINTIKILLENGATVPDFSLQKDNNSAQVFQILQDFNIDSDTIIKLLCMRNKDIHPFDYIEYDL